MKPCTGERRQTTAPSRSTRRPQQPSPSRSCRGRGSVAGALALDSPSRRWPSRRRACASGAARPDDVLLVLLAWVGVLLAAWLALGSLLGIASLLPGASGSAGGAGRRARHSARGAQGADPRARRLGRLHGPTTGCGLERRLGPRCRAARPERPGPSGPRTAVRRPARGSAPGPAPTRRLLPTPGYVPTSGAAAGDRPGPGHEPPAGAARQPRATSRQPRPRSSHAERSRLLAPSPRAAAATQDLVTVRRGDSLWAIAARHLGPGASDAQIAREWPRWYAANRDVVGDDPDLLVAGQQLRPPSSVTTSTRSHARDDCPRRARSIR